MMWGFSIVLVAALPIMKPSSWCTTAMMCKMQATIYLSFS